MSNLVEAHNLIEKAIDDLVGYNNQSIVDIKLELINIRQKLADIIW